MEKKYDFLTLAQVLIEIDDKDQLLSYEQKLNEYVENPSAVFDDGEYYYDTQNQRFQMYRGDNTELKENTEWFLMIDNFIFGNFL